MNGMECRREFPRRVGGIEDVAGDLSLALASFAQTCREAAATYTDGNEDCTAAWLGHLGALETRLRDMVVEVKDATHLAQLMRVLFATHNVSMNCERERK